MNGLVALVALLGAGSSGIPLIGRVGGIAIGSTTLPAFVKAHGRGLTFKTDPIAGGCWFDRTSRCLIDTSSYRPDGTIEELDVTFMQTNSTTVNGIAVPEIRVRDRDLGLLAVLRRGMQQWQVEKAIGHSLDRHGQVRLTGTVGEHRASEYWRVWFDFGPDGLTGFLAWCGANRPGPH